MDIKLEVIIICKMILGMNGILVDHKLSLLSCEELQDDYYVYDKQV